MRALVVAVTLLAVNVAWAQKRLPDIPENHWVFVTFRSLKERDIIDGRTRDAFHPTEMPRYSDLAVWTFEACSSLLQQLENAEANQGKADPILKREAAKSAVKLRTFQKEIDNLVRMLKIFANELKSRRVDTVALAADMQGFIARADKIISNAR